MGVYQAALTDAQLIEASEHDPNQFGEIADRHFAEIHGYIARRVGRDMAADLGSETFAIAFDGNKADIAADSLGLLDRVSAAIARCPDAAVEVGAHSDNEGTTARNRDKTQARAEAIVEFLVSAGIKRERLTAVGYGEANPVGDNNTEAGRAANQRIEFSVALPDGG